ncbi:MULTISPECIES: hypothetical protein [unclassified Vibrio]|uniref:hypothetical protein n=1 Tax=unclassified Vibrio TaxID=2614977 RepID=UPI00354FED4A
MKIIFEYDYPVAFGTHGIDTDIPFEHARKVGGEIVDVSMDTTFFIDSGGRKHVLNIDNYQQLDCHINDELILDNGIWRIETASDVYQIKRTDIAQQRQLEYTQRVRPYLEEAEIKKHMGDQSEYNRLMDLAVEEREKVQTQNPWPTPPTS